MELLYHGPSLASSPRCLNLIEPGYTYSQCTDQHAAWTSYTTAIFIYNWLAGRIYPGGTSLNSPGGPFYMIPGGIIGHEGGPCIILLLVPLGPVNILYLVWGTNSDMIFGPMGPLLGGTSFTVTGPMD